MLQSRYVKAGTAITDHAISSPVQWSSVLVIDSECHRKFYTAIFKCLVVPEIYTNDYYI